MEILTPKGFVKASRLRKGSKVMSIDFNTGERIINTVEKLDIWNKKTYDKFSQGDFDCYKINDNLELYKNQSIFCNGRCIHAKDVKVGDTIYDENFNEVRVVLVEKTQGHIWHRFRISGDHTYITKGALLHNANRFWIGQSGGGNYSSTDWSTTSGGGGGSAAPTSSDDVTFDGAGTFGNTNCTCTVAAAALSLSFTTGYTATITQNTNISITVSGNFTDRTQHTWTIVGGTAALIINAASTITSNGKTYPGPVQLTGTNTKTLSGDWTISGSLTTAQTLVMNSGTINVAGGFAPAACSGSTTFNLTGGTWSGNGGISNAVNFTGNITYSATGTYTGTMTYVSGTVTTTSSTLTLGTSTMNTNGISWNNISIAGTATITINSLLTATGTMTLSGTVAITFGGTSGFTVGTLNITATANNTLTLANTVTYTVTTSLTAFTSRTGSTFLFTSDHATNQAILTLNQGATNSVLANFTRIDASAGRTIYTFHGTVTSCNNIVSYTDGGDFPQGKVIVIQGNANY